MGAWGTLRPIVGTRESLMWRYGACLRAPTPHCNGDKECRTWKDQIRKLWKKIGEVSGESTLKDRSRHKDKGRGKGFGVWESGRKVRPGNCSMSRLFGDSRFTTAVLKFLEETDVGKIKKGVHVRGVAAE